MVGPFLFIVNLLNYKIIKFDDNQKFFLIFSIPIFIIVFFEAVIVRANANWAAPALITFYLFLFNTLNKKNSIFFRLNLVFNTCFCALFFALISISYPPYIFNRVIGINKFAENVFLIGNDAKINDLVISDRLLFANLSYELRNKEFYFHMPHKELDVITNHFKITSRLKENMSRDFIFVGHLDDINYLNNNFTFKEKSLDKESSFGNKFRIYEINFD
tara:strand:- start:824 stop:1477 length:654 start_codon:yes stop_codon:yes gene_type:complete